MDSKSYQNKEDHPETAQQMRSPPERANESPRRSCPVTHNCSRSFVLSFALRAAFPQPARKAQAENDQQAYSREHRACGTRGCVLEVGLNIVNAGGHFDLLHSVLVAQHRNNFAIDPSRPTRKVVRLNSQLAWLINSHRDFAMSRQPFQNFACSAFGCDNHGRSVGHFTWAGRVFRSKPGLDEVHGRAISWLCERA